MFPTDEGDSLRRGKKQEVIGREADMSDRKRWCFVVGAVLIQIRFLQSLVTENSLNHTCFFFNPIPNYQNIPGFLLSPDFSQLEKLRGELFLGDFALGLISELQTSAYWTPHSNRTLAKLNFSFFCPHVLWYPVFINGTVSYLLVQAIVIFNSSFTTSSPISSHLHLPNTFQILSRLNSKLIYFQSFPPDTYLTLPFWRKCFSAMLPQNVHISILNLCSWLSEGSPCLSDLWKTSRHLHFWALEEALHSHGHLLHGVINELNHKDGLSTYYMSCALLGTVDAGVSKARSGFYPFVIYPLW